MAAIVDAIYYWARDIYKAQSEAAWRGLTEDNFSQPFLVTYGSFIAHLGFYFVFCAVVYSYKLFPRMDKCKLQPGIQEPTSSQPKVVATVVITKFITWVPVLSLYYGVFPELIQHIQVGYDTIGPWYKVVCVVMGCLLVDDTWHYWQHRLSHWSERMFSGVHKVCHEFRAPFGISGEYTHPLETLLSVPGLLIGPYFFAEHVLELYVFLLFKTWIALVAHSGYDVWYLNPAYLIPGYLGVEPLDLHHEMCLDGNFGATFTFWDKLCRTYVTRDSAVYRRRPLVNGHTQKLD